MSTSGNGHSNALDAWSARVSSALGASLKTAQLSSAQRCEQMDRVVAQVAALTARVNEQTQAIHGLQREVRGAHARPNENEVIARAARNRINEFAGMTFWQRLRWLVRG